MMNKIRLFLLAVVISGGLSSCDDTPAPITNLKSDFSYNDYEEITNSKDTALVTFSESKRTVYIMMTDTKEVYKAEITSETNRATFTLGGLLVWTIIVLASGIFVVTIN